MRRQRGQAAVELAAVAPLVVLLALALAQVVLAARAGLQAEQAAARAVAAAAGGGDPVGAAADGLPDGARVTRAGAQVTVAVPVPTLLRSLGIHPRVSAEAWVGP